MATIERAVSVPDELIGVGAPASVAGPAPDDGAPVALPPRLAESRLRQTVAFGPRPLALFSRLREAGVRDVATWEILAREEPIVVTWHPDHIKSLFTAKPEQAPSITGESPLRPILGPNSVLTAVGPRHMRQRKMLLPPFHGEAIERYMELIAEAVDVELSRWQVGSTFSLAPRMQAVTLDVIMGGIFGVAGRPEPGSPEDALRNIVRRMLRLAATDIWALIDLHNMGRDEPRGPLKWLMAEVDKRFFAVISARRAAAESTRGADVLSLLLAARTEEGEALTDQELRDELLTLVLAGHETTANTLAWAFERLVRNPAAYDALRDEARSSATPGPYVEATIHEAMRVRPVIPMVGRYVTVPWQLGEYRLPAGTPVGMNIVLLHHREDVYPDPFSFRPERFLGVKPGTYTWIPFGGGIRRCLGAALAMAEMRAVLHAVAARTDLAFVDARSERARQRNVTMIPEFGGRVTVTGATGMGST